jgi:mRNA-degrading endonuclease RelE of RelBE toxin-antitoxin system
MPFRITTEPKFRKRLMKKPTSQQGAILECIDRLSQDPRHPGLRTSRIQGKSSWEARVDSTNRLEWEYGQPDEIILINHCSHNDIYR